MQQYLVKPRVADINENVLSEQIVTESNLTEDMVKNGVPLEAAIQQVRAQHFFFITSCVADILLILMYCFYVYSDLFQ